MLTCSIRGRLPVLVVVSASVISISISPGTSRRAEATTPAPIRFQDLSAVSGGPVDFGTPKSDLETSACAFFDADGDGWDDFVTLTGRGEPFGYFLNRDDGAGGRKFVPAPPGNGLDTGPCLERDGASVTAGDVDDDGDEDLFVGFSWNSVFDPGEGQSALFLNDGSGRFAEVTADVGLLAGDNTTAAALFFDMDLDGDLDLFTCNTDVPYLWKEGDSVAHLWRNELRETGTLHFVDETAARGVVEKGDAVWSATGVDDDGDGDFDLMISHDIAGPTQLLRNDGTGHFTDVTDAAGRGDGDDSDPSTFGDDAYSGMGIAWGDTDNDGDPDVYVTSVGHSPFYRNNGDGTFTQVARRSGVEGGLSAWGCTFQDFDLDGFADLYVGGGDVWDFARPDVRSFLYRNRGDGTFEDVWATSGMRHDTPLHREGGVASADFDRDGRPDLLVARAERRGASPYLYRNTSETAGRRWLTLALRGNGRSTNTSAIGARIRVVPRDAAGVAIPGLAQFREINGGDSRGSRSSLAQTVGLGPSAVSADVTVVWPRGGTLAARSQTWTDLPLDQRVELTEGARLATWRLAPESAATVAAGRPTALRCKGIGDRPDPLTRISVWSGPSWVTIGPHGADGAPAIVVTPPAFDAETSVDVVLRAVAQWVDDPESKQTLHLTTRPVPRVTSAKQHGRTVVVRGAHLDLSGLVVRSGGVAIAPSSVGVTKIKLRLPRSVAAAVGRTMSSRLELFDPLTGVVVPVRIRR